MWTWTLFFSWMFVGRAAAGPQYMVAIPATLESGAETKLCASLLQPNETLVMVITLKSSEENTTLFKQASNKDFHSCTQFTVSTIRTLTEIT
ncbi:Pregnancy zone protein [Liparis tanakae]|uniref:Pregnancy zone protein n=1 Tax=Liparis tanakae TaxID=230148 RepID=A0A4Z2EE88_9TELE|nr:Pregnancy zone protein [Liparis tanakae]